jgi:hypothetical protein
MTIMILVKHASRPFAMHYRFFGGGGGSGFSDFGSFGSSAGGRESKDSIWDWTI